MFSKRFKTPKVVRTGDSDFFLQLLVISAFLRSSYRIQGRLDSLSFNFTTLEPLRANSSSFSRDYETILFFGRSMRRSFRLVFLRALRLFLLWCKPQGPSSHPSSCNCKFVYASHRNALMLYAIQTKLPCYSCIAQE